MKTNGDILKEQAIAMGRTGRTLEQVQAAMAKAKKDGGERSMARLMLRFGVLRPEVRAWLEKEYP